MNSKKFDVAIVGAGIIGLCSAHYLQKKGYSVRVVEASKKLEGCSHGNAGHICESHIIPLANSGVFKKSILWLLNSSSPFYIRPRMNRDLISWGRKFIGSSFEKSHKKKIEFLARFGKESLQSYLELFHEIGFSSVNRKGIITLCNSEEGLEEEKEMASLNREFGIIPTHLKGSDLKSIEPKINLNAKGGVLYKNDLSVDPTRLIDELCDHLLGQGVEIEFNTRVEELVIENGKATALKTNRGSFDADRFLVCTGAWAPELWNKLGSRILMQPAKGYSLEIPNRGQVRSSSLIFSEKKVVLTPMGDRIRIAGTLELGGFDDKIRRNRVKGILSGMREFAPDLYNEKLEEEDVWYGYRPTSPDGLPYIGQHDKIPNLFINAGHAMLGLALGAASGEMIAGIINGDDPELSSPVVDPLRFSR